MMSRVEWALHLYHKSKDSKEDNKNYHSLLNEYLSQLSESEIHEYNECLTRIEINMKRLKLQAPDIKTYNWLLIAVETEGVQVYVKNLSRCLLGTGPISAKFEELIKSFGVIVTPDIQYESE